MTEHAAVIFVFFFLAEYASIVVICTLTSILFLGGYLIDLSLLLYIYNAIVNIFDLFSHALFFTILSVSPFLEIIYDIITINLCLIYTFPNISTIYESDLYMFFNLLKIDISNNIIIYSKEDIINNIKFIFFEFNDITVHANNVSFFGASNTMSNNFYSGLFSSIILGIKSSFMIFVFIWARASFPRIRFDQLMSFCWTVLLPVVVAFIILVPCILYAFDILPTNIVLL